MNRPLRKTCTLPLQRLETLRDLLGVGATVEGADAEVALALRAESAAGRDNHVHVVEDLVERLPARDAIRSLRPDIRCIRATVHSEAGGFCSGYQHLGVAHIVLDEFVHLLLAFGGVERFGCALHWVTYTVELRAHA